MRLCRCNSIERMQIVTYLLVWHFIFQRFSRCKSKASQVKVIAYLLERVHIVVDLTLCLCLFQDEVPISSIEYKFVVAKCDVLVSISANIEKAEKQLFDLLLLICF